MMQTVTHTIVGMHQAPDDREQMGRFLRHAFPLGLESFTDVGEFLDGEKDMREDVEPAMFTAARRQR